ncbi:unnamed protein product, partial [Prorocentrum cordatum]
ERPGTHSRGRPQERVRLRGGARGGVPDRGAGEPRGAQRRRGRPGTRPRAARLAPRRGRRGRRHEWRRRRGVRGRRAAAATVPSHALAPDVGPSARAAVQAPAVHGPRRVPGGQRPHPRLQQPVALPALQPRAEGGRPLHRHLCGGSARRHCRRGGGGPRGARRLLEGGGASDWTRRHWLLQQRRRGP